MTLLISVDRQTASQTQLTYTRGLHTGCAAVLL